MSIDIINLSQEQINLMLERKKQELLDIQTKKKKEEEV
jgi:hypothetical protein